MIVYVWEIDGLTLSKPVAFVKSASGKYLTRVETGDIPCGINVANGDKVIPNRMPSEAGARIAIDVEGGFAAHTYPQEHAVQCARERIERHARVYEELGLALRSFKEKI